MGALGMKARSRYTIGMEEETLLAVDLGLRTGLALYGRKRGLLWYRSQNFGSSARLKRRVHTLMGELGGLAHVVVEGRGTLADVWVREAERRGIGVTVVSAEEWREALMPQRHRRTGLIAKQHADVLARRVIENAPHAPRPTSLRHDAAEAVLVGLWGVVRLGWRAAMH